MMSSGSSEFDGKKEILATDCREQNTPKRLCSTVLREGRAYLGLVGQAVRGVVSLHQDFRSYNKHFEAVHRMTNTAELDPSQAHWSKTFHREEGLTAHLHMCPQLL